MTAATYNLLIDAGATYTKTFTYKDSAGDAIDLTGYTAALQARQQKGDVATILDLTIANGGITMGGAAGTILVTITDTLTSAMTVQRGVYDLLLTDGSGNITRLVEGYTILSLGVTE